MTPYQIEQLKISARADFARSPALQAEFETPETYAAYRAAVARGAVVGKATPPVESDPAKAAFRRIWESMPEAQAQWPGGFEAAWRAHLAAESARCCPGLHTTGTIYGRAA
jgi:hypothetical protein